MHQLTTFFHRRLVRLGIGSVFDDYGPGTHSWPYWARDLRESIGPLMRIFAARLGAPKRIDYTSADGRYRIYGWQVAMHRKVREFSYLQRAWSRGFELRGSGSATVVTPPLFARRHSYVVNVATASRRRTVVLHTGRSRRLTIKVPLGPSNTVQEFPADGPPVGTKIYATTVTIG